jgi:hypothetical protein
MPRTRTSSRPVKRRSTTTAANPNHHLWQHGKNWWVYCAINPTPRTKDKLRRSLCTESVETARFRRDELFRQLHAEGMLGRIRAGVRPAKMRPVAALAGTSAGELTWQQRTDAMLAMVLSINPDDEDFPAPVVGAGQGKLQLCCS